MLGSWRVDGPRASLRVVVWSEASEEDRKKALAPDGARQVLLDALAGTFDERALLAEMCDELGAPVRQIDPPVPIDTLRRRVADAVTRERLLVVREAARGAELGRVRENEQAAAEPANAATRQWIAIRLVDPEGNPVPGRRYEITLPDGSVAEGSLDAAGFARVGGIIAGTCKIKFPDLHGPDWKAA